MQRQSLDGGDRPAHQFSADADNLRHCLADWHLRKILQRGVYNVAPSLFTERREIKSYFPSSHHRSVGLSIKRSLRRFVGAGRELSRCPR
jgi:hypothetical protein